MPEKQKSPPQAETTEKQLTDAEMDTVAGGIVIIGDTAGLKGKSGSKSSGSTNPGR